MVYGIDDDSLNCFGQRANSTGDGGTHLALRIGIDCKNGVGIVQVSFEVCGSWALANNDNNSLNSAAAHVLDAGFKHGLGTEGQQGFECAHALGTPGGEDYCRNRIGLWS
jgi:hypothetical protein